MTIHKSLVSLNFNPMRDEEILAEFQNVKKQTSIAGFLGLIHLGIGLLLLGYGLWNIIQEQYNPLVGISVLGDILQILIEIPFFFIFLGLVEIFASIAILFRKFGTLLYHAGAIFASSIATNLIATNFRLIYTITGEAGLHSLAEDLYYDQMEQLECTFPSKKTATGIILAICGIAISIFPLIPIIESVSLWNYSLSGSLTIITAGVLMIILGLIIRARKTPYLITIGMNSTQKKIRFVLDRQNSNTPNILSFARGFKFGVNRS